jgi:hypothetical protein
VLSVIITPQEQSELGLIRPKWDIDDHPNIVKIDAHNVKDVKVGDIIINVDGWIDIVVRREKTAIYTTQLWHDGRTRSDGTVYNNEDDFYDDDYLIVE